MHLPPARKLPYLCCPMPATLEKPIVIYVPGIADARGRIVRVVGNSVAYVSLESGDSLAFSAEDIDHYAGESFRNLGLFEGAPVSVTADPNTPSEISIQLKAKEPVAQVDDEVEQLCALLAKAKEQPGVREVMQVYGQCEQAAGFVASFQAHQNQSYPPSTVTSSSEPI